MQYMPQARDSTTSTRWLARAVGESAGRRTHVRMSTPTPQGEDPRSATTPGPPGRSFYGLTGSNVSIRTDVRMSDASQWSQRNAEGVDMPSGGARARSGPAPDPNALRRDRKDDADWVVLPAEGFNGEVPRFPLSAALGAESDLWAILWRKPQAFMWAKLGLEFEVAAYVRAFLESTEAEASAGLKTAVLRMAAEIGLSLPGMHSLRWRFAEDEIGERRDTGMELTPSQRARLKAVNG